LLEQEGALEPHLQHGAVEARASLSGAVVGFFDVVQPPFQLDAFSVVGFFDGRREGCVE